MLNDLMEYILTTENLTKVYGNYKAADNINIHIKEGDYVDFHIDENDNIIIKKQGYTISRKIQNIIDDVIRVDSESPVIDILRTAKNKFIELYGEDNV